LAANGRRNPVYMKMPVSVRIFSSFVVPVPGMEVIERTLFKKSGQVCGDNFLDLSDCCL
jgi:hypothetical protein